LNPNLNWGTAKVPQLPTIEGLNPELVESGQTDAQLTDINWASYWAEGVYNKSPNKEEAWKFLEFLASAEGLADFYLAASQIREFGEIYPRKSMVNKLTDNKKLVAFLEMADKSVSGWPSSRTWDDGLNDELSKYFEASISQGDWNEEKETALFSGISRVVDLYKIK
jgi:ABC-type glycerol-3-phosphate transport system substrate-binding protein